MASEKDECKRFFITDYWRKFDKMPDIARTEESQKDTGVLIEK